MVRILVRAENWIKDVKVKEKSKTPKGLFTENSSKIVRELLKLTDNDIGKAIRKITFYINRAGQNLSNEREIEKAKKELMEMNEKKKKEQSSVLSAQIDLMRDQIPADPQDQLKFVKVAKSDNGFQDVKSYFINDVVNNDRIYKKFTTYVKRNYPDINLNNQVSTRKSADFSSEIEPFIEQTFGRPFKTYFGDGLFGVWVSEIDLGSTKVVYLILEEPKSPSSRIICVKNAADLNALNKLLDKWKAGKKGIEMKTLSRVKTQAYKPILDPKLSGDSGSSSDVMTLREFKKYVDQFADRWFDLRLEYDEGYDLYYLVFNGNWMPLIHNRTNKHVTKDIAQKIFKQASDFTKKAKLNMIREALVDFEKDFLKKPWRSVEDVQQELYEIKNKF